MWNILGEEAIYLDIPYKFKNRVLALAVDDENGKKFKGLMDKSDVSFMINGESEECCFIIKVPDEYTPEEIQLMADQTMAAIVANDRAPISANGMEQKYKIIISNDKEPEIIGLRKTPGMTSVEVFKPIFRDWVAPGKSNPYFSGSNRY